MDTALQEVQFDEASHRYYIGNDTYTSATQLIEQFKNKFETQKMSEWMSYRYGNTPQYWIAKWKKENGDSLKRGNGIHAREEKRLLVKGYDLMPYPVPVHEHAGDIVYYNLPDGIYPELKLWRNDCRIAGRADKIVLMTLATGKDKRPQRFMNIDDHKTNKIIRTESFQNRETGEYAMMLGPLTHLMDCELVHYTLQLSLYQYMGEYHGFLPGWRRIIHHRHPIPGVAQSGAKVINLPYLRDEVIAMIKHAV